MPAAAFLPSSVLTPPPAAGAALDDHFSVYDEQDEWKTFSKPCKPLPNGAPVWESQLLVQGMRCAGCALALEEALLVLPGVNSARVSASSRRASITWSPDQTLPSKWILAAKAAGFTLQPAADVLAPDSGREDARLVLWRWLVAGFCMMQVMMYAAPAYFTAAGEITPDLDQLLRWASWVLTLPVVLFSCSPFFKHALRDLRQRRIGMDLPVALGIAMTFAISTAATFEPRGWWGGQVYFDSLTMFVFFLLTGRWLEQRLRQRTAGSLELLMRRLPASVERQLADGSCVRVAVRSLQCGDTVRILPGEAFPADGTVLSGHTLADEALLTGESRPVARPAGSSVLAGSYNLSQPVLVRVDQLGSATRYAQIVALMEQASVDKPRLAVLADRAARPFLAFVLLAAVGAAAFWWQDDPARALMAAVAVLVVTCPCALSLATPSAMLTSAGWLARQGVLVRRLQAIESLAAIDTVVFDKTGTLTHATAGCTTAYVRKGLSAQEALQWACLLAAQSLHPVSRALAAAGNANPALPADAAHQITAVAEVAGQGVHGLVEPSATARCSGRLRLGNARFCQVPDMGGSGLRVYLADESGLVARFELGEAPRVDALRSVAALQAGGLDVRMLSGDRQDAVSSMAATLGIPHAQGNCSPESKLASLAALQRKGRRVLMVGDGLNDGPVLASANVSVAIGSAVPLAQAQSDFVMPDGQLLMLPAMLIQAKKTMRIVRQNLWWAACYNALCVPLAVAGYMPAWLAGLGMAMSSLLVIGNAARLGAAGVAPSGTGPRIDPDNSTGPIKAPASA
ncbi:MAG: heavy metal translocating P-type ATPase [Polaromonas sp.]|nr:heavy metal translocating P-type ATPase [Polaromonas sp.]